MEELKAFRTEQTLKMGYLEQKLVLFKCLKTSVFVVAMF
jgi:hypothetical protein